MADFVMQGYSGLIFDTDNAQRLFIGSDPLNTLDPSVQIRFIMVSMRSSPHRADVLGTPALSYSNLPH